MRRHGAIRVDGSVVDAHYLWFAREELRLYSKRKRQLQEIILDHAWRRPSAETGMPGGNGPGTPTETRGIALAGNTDYEVLRGAVERIDSVLADLEESTRVILQMIVMDGAHTAENIVPYLETKGITVSVSTVHRELNRGLLAIAIAWFGLGIVESAHRKKKRKSR